VSARRRKRGRATVRNDKAVAVTCLMPALAGMGALWCASDGGVAARVFLSASIAGLIGTLVDWMAVEMVFARRWWIPFSGVIPRNKDAIVEAVASMVGSRWFTPTALAAYLEEMDLKAALEGGLREVLLSRDVQRDLRAHLVRGALGRLEASGAEAYAAEKAGEAIRRGLGRLPEPLASLGRGAVELGLMDVLDLPGKAGRAVLESTRVALRGAAEGGDLERLFREETERLIPVLVNPASERAIKKALVEIFAGHVDVGKLVRRNLSSLPAEAVRELVESKGRTHLEWIRVNGAIGGFVLGGLFEALRLSLGVA